MHVLRFRSINELAPWAQQWNELARGMPYRSYPWHTGWWRHYGATSTRYAELCVLAVVDDNGTLVGLAPWYLERSAASGRVLRFLASGEVCSEYQTVLSRPGREGEVVEAVAGWLMRFFGPEAAAAQSDTGRWDLLEMSSVDAVDPVVNALVERLKADSCNVHRRDGMPCWRLELPGTWEEYLPMLSKQLRRKVKTAEREYFDAGRVTLHTVADVRELPAAWERFIELHQRRRVSLGQPGCFVSSAFGNFHREFAEEWLASGGLRLHWLEVDSRAVAVEYHMYGDEAIFAYQSGVDPDAMEHQPGHLASIATIKRAIQQGARAVDFLRGDEPYKKHWRAEPRPINEFRVVPPTVGARIRHGAWAASDNVKNWIKGGLELAGVSRDAV